MLCPSNSVNIIHAPPELEVSITLGRQLPALFVTNQQQELLTAVSPSTSMPHGIMERGRIVLACAEGLTKTAVAERLDVLLSLVGKWRYVDRGLEVQHDELRPGRSRT